MTYYKLVRKRKTVVVRVTNIPATSKFIAWLELEQKPSSFCRISLSPNCDSQFLDFLYFCEKKDISC